MFIPKIKKDEPYARTYKTSCPFESFASFYIRIRISKKIIQSLRNIVFITNQNIKHTQGKY